MLTEWELPLHSFLIRLPIGALLIHRGDSRDSLRREKSQFQRTPGTVPSTQGTPDLPKQASTGVCVGSSAAPRKPGQEPLPTFLPQPNCWAGLLLLGEFIDTDAPRE